MAESKLTLTVLLTPKADEELWEVWSENLERYNFERAESYDAFLKTCINALANTYDEGKKLDRLPELRYITLKHSRKGDGHYVIYEIDNEMKTVNILHIFHTKMDVGGRLESEF